MGVVPLVVLADDRAEVEETFLVRLVSVAGGALLDTTKANITVTVRAMADIYNDVALSL